MNNCVGCTQVESASPISWKNCPEHGDVRWRWPKDDLMDFIYAQEKQLKRAAYLVHHLADQVPEWTGVIGPAGEKEDDFIRDELHEEANRLFRRKR